MSGIYIHIPYCKQACNYCNFHFSVSQKNKKELLRAIATEMQLRKDYLEDKKINTLYFGGGTPSLLQEEDLVFIWQNLQRHFDVSALSEITLEANPDDLNAAYLNMLRKQNINRLSIGIQSFKDTDLLYMNRAHNADDAINCITLAQKAGFENISIDLIYGTPGLSNKDWKQNIITAINTGVTHLSAYALTVEDNTALHRNIQKGIQTEPNNEQMAEQFEILVEQTQKAGFSQYEISNFAKDKQYAQHNTSYWKGTHYLGLGPSAHSYNGIGRQWNIANNTLYIHNLLQQNTLPITEEMLSLKDQFNEYIMISLRTKWGINIEVVKEKFGTEKAAQLLVSLEELENKNDVFRNANDNYVLTHSAKFFADGIAASLFEG